MKNVFILVFVVIFISLPVTALSDTPEGYVDISNNYWVFFEPQEYDLTKEEVISMAWQVVEEQYMPSIGHGDILENCEVSAFYILAINEDLGEHCRYWRVKIHYDGSPYHFLQFDINTPTGEMDDYYNYGKLLTWKKLLPDVKDLDAVHQALPKMIENDLIPSFSEELKLSHYEIDEVPPQQYKYAWGMCDMRILPVKIFFTDAEDSIVEKEYFISINYSYSTREWHVFLVAKDAEMIWNSDTPNVYGKNIICSYHVYAYK